MKTLSRLLLPLFLLLFITASAQVELVNTSLTDSSKKYVYIGVDNIIEIRNAGSSGNLKLDVTGGTLVKKSATRYVFTTKLEDDFTFSVIKDGRTVLKQSFTTHYLGEVKVILGDLTDSLVTVEQVLQNPFLKVIMPYSIHTVEFPIHSFKTVILTRTDGHTLEAKGNRLTDAQINKIKELKPKELIIFNEIQSTHPNGRKFNLPAFRLEIR